jgi:hypothetical protein
VKQMSKNLRANGILARVFVVPVLVVAPVVVTAVPATASTPVVDGGVRGVR